MVKSGNLIKNNMKENVYGLVYIDPYTKEEYFYTSKLEVEEIRKNFDIRKSKKATKHVLDIMIRENVLYEIILKNKYVMFIALH